jgi:hypothetical protein
MTLHQEGINMRISIQLGLISTSLIFIACARPESEDEDIAIERANLEVSTDTISEKSALSLERANKTLRNMSIRAASSCVVRVGGRGAKDSNSGASWNAPMATIQAAIDRAQALADSGGFSNCNVWIRTGTFKPSSTSGFTLGPKIGLYGGFRGTETSPAQRLVGNKSTLNGPVTTYSSSGGVVDAIRFPYGLTVSNGTFGVNDCTFYGSGTAISGRQGSFAITNSEFSNSGPAVSCHCGIAVSGSAFFNSGIALQTGGGNSVSATNSTFVGVGSGISVVEGYATVRSSVFQSISGMAIYVNDGMMTVSDSVFEEIDGNAIGLNLGGATITNCKFWDNASTCISASGMPTSVTVSTSTFNSNYASQASVASISGSYARIFLGSSIIWGNGANSVVANGGASVYFDNSDVEGGATGTGLLNVDPQFVEPSIGDLHLATTSPLVGLNWGYQYP